MISDPYAVLGLTRQATALEVKEAYFKLVHDYPPERDPEGFQRIRAAYEALRTPTARARTDRQFVQPPPPYVPPRRLPPFDLAYHPEDRWLEVRRQSDLEQLDFQKDFRPISDLSEESI